MKCSVAIVLIFVWIEIDLGCGPRPEIQSTRKSIHIENQYHASIRVYVANENDSPVRTLIGTVEARQDEFLSLPTTTLPQAGVVVCCEVGRTGVRYETQLVTIPLNAQLYVTVRDPIEYSDFGLKSAY